VAEGDLVRVLEGMGKAAVPVEDAEQAAARRERVVSALGNQIISVHERRSRRFTAAVLLGVAAAAAVGVGLFSLDRLRSADGDAQVAVAALSAGEVRGVVGRALSKSGSARRIEIEAGTRLRGGEELETFDGGALELRIDRGDVRLGAMSKLEVLSPTAKERRLRLGVGTVDVDVPHLGRSSERFVVETPSVDVVVVGTAFSVDVGGSVERRETNVNVRRGTVWIFAHGDRLAVLKAGDSWSSEAKPSAAGAQPPAPPAPPAAASADDALKPTRKLAGAADVRATGASPKEIATGSLAEENRLFEAGLSARNAGDDGRAADAFGNLLARYPRSVLSEQALAERFRALSRAGRTALAVTAARRYLAAYPQGVARGDAERIASGLLEGR
jgi:hypothetical protein